MASNSIDINFSGLGSDISGGGGPSSNFLHSVLQKLDSTIDKLNNNIQKVTAREEAGTLAGAAGGGSNSSIDRNSHRMGYTMGTAFAAAVGISTFRILNNQANAIMARATNAGGFMAAAMGGQANQAFGSYAANYITTEGQRVMANNNAILEGAGGVGAASLGAFGGIGIAADVFGLGSAGAGAGDLVAAKAYNQYVQEQMMVQAAKVQRNADAATSQWKVGFQRFGLGMTSHDIVSSAFTHGKPITGMFADAFMNKYQGDQNFKAIQENIVPFLPTGSNPTSNTINLGNIAQNFIKAGFAVQDFAKLTMQGSQYQALTGKNMQKFSEDLINARYKFGDAYSVGNSQIALNLMQLGYGKDTAQHLAYQSNFNSGLLSNVGAYASSSFSDYYRKQAIGDQLGIDINASQRTGHIVETRKGAGITLQNQLRSYLAGGAQTTDMALLQTVMSNPQFMSLAQNMVSEGKSLTPKRLKDLASGKLGPGQANANAAGVVADLMQTVSNMNVTATGTVNIISQQDVGKSITEIPGDIYRYAKSEYRSHFGPSSTPHPSGTASVKH